MFPEEESGDKIERICPKSIEIGEHCGMFREETQKDDEAPDNTCRYKEWNGDCL